MATIGPEVTALQLRGAKANVGLRPANTNPLGGAVAPNQNLPTIPEGPKAALKPAGQIAVEELIMGFRDPAATTHSDPFPVQGYIPGYRFIQPPGVGRPDQHIYDTYALAPKDLIGTGTEPNTYLRSVMPPVIQNFAMRQNGYAVSGGNLLLTGLYAPDPIVPPSNP